MTPRGTGGDAQLRPKKKRKERKRRRSKLQHPLKNLPKKKSFSRETLRDLKPSQLRRAKAVEV